MADILHLGKKLADLRPKSDNSLELALGGADIIFFPGVRYERELAPPLDPADQLVSPAKPSSKKIS